MGKLSDIALQKYSTADPLVRMKARLIFYLYCTILIIIPIVIASTAYVDLHEPTLGFQIQYLLILPQLILFMFCVGCIILLLRGHYVISAHLLLIMTLMTIWAVMIMDSSKSVIRLDTIALILGVMTMTPFVVTRRGWAILLYGGVNMIVFIAFTFYFRDDFGITHDAFVDYLVDNGIAIIFITITSFSIFIIYRSALDNIANELEKRKRATEVQLRLEAQLSHAQKLESVGRLAGGIAHDFNNLLTAIMGNTGLMLMEKKPGDTDHDRLTDVMRAAESAADLTRQLLAFSRKQVIEPVIINLNSLIERLEKMLGRLIGEDVRLRTILQPGLGSIRTDIGQVEQIIINLAVNARDAMSGGGELIIETANVDIDEAYMKRHPYTCTGNYVMMSVSDTGIGMTDEVKMHIFEPFYTTKPVGKGTGLGLATVYGAVKQNGGSIEVYSEPGNGTTFRIYFPHVASEEDIAPQKMPPLEKPPTGTETILLVEDNQRVRDFVVGVLTRQGYQVLYAENGSEAMKLADDHEDIIHLMLCDVILPDMNGRRLAAKLTHKRPDMRVIFTSGYAEDVIIHHGVLEKGIHFISKPFSFNTLATKIRSVLDDDAGREK